MRIQTILVIIVLTLLSVAFANTGHAADNAAIQSSEKLNISADQADYLNIEDIKRVISLYRNLSEDKQAQVRQVVAQIIKAQQEAIEAVQQQINELKLNETDLHAAKNYESGEEAI